jgi:hypothetical protein
MRHASKILLAFFVVGGFHQVVAQSKEASYGEISKMEQAAMVLILSIPHRRTMTSWVFPDRDKEPTWKSVLISEIIPPDRSRWIQENIVSESGSFKRMEVVSVGGTHYQKIDKGPWYMREPPPPPVVPIASPLPSAPRPRFENSAQLLETLTERGRLVSVYETKSKSTREVDGKEVIQINTSRYWFRDDGILLRKDGELETVGEPRILKNSTVYEYDDIRIEAPKVNQ